MRINQSSQSNQKTFQLGQLKGVDISSSPLNVKSTRASSMVNMINRDGINHKRNGWKDTITFYDDDGNTLPVNGVFEFREYNLTTSKYYKIVHAGNMFFKCSNDLATIIEKITIQEGTNIENSRSQGFYNNDKLWILGAGDYVVYDGNIIQPAKESMYAYIPTTSIGIAGTQNSSAGETYEGVNLLTKQRINKLVGGQSVETETFYLDGKPNLGKPIKVEIELELGGENASEDNLVKTWYYSEEDDEYQISKADVFTSNIDDYELLDAFGYTGIQKAYDCPSVTFNIGTPVQATNVRIGAMDDNYIPGLTFKFYDGTSFTYSGGGRTAEPSELIGKCIKSITMFNSMESDKTNLRSIAIKGHKLYTGVVYLEYELNKSIIDTRTTAELVSATSEKGESIRLINYNLLPTVYSYPKNAVGKIEFNKPVPSPVQGVNNIGVTYFAEYEDKAFKFTSACEFALGTEANILLLSSENIVYYSDFGVAGKVKDYGYIPDNHYIGLGNGKEPITALQNIGGAVGVFKENENYTVTFNVLKNTDDYEVSIVPTATNFYQGIGCDNAFVLRAVNYDTLIFNKNGIQGISHSASSKVLNMRSTNVNKDLCAFTRAQRKEAVACEHEGRYYLFIDNKVYIGDTRFKSYESNRLDTSFEYEWWIWDNCPARCVYSFDGKMYIGKADGNIAVFDDKYTDRSRTAVMPGQMVCYGDCFVFDDALKVSSGDKVELTNALEVLSDYKNLTQIDIASYQIELDANEVYLKTEDGYQVKLYEGMQLILHGKNGIDVPVIIEKIEGNIVTMACLARIALDITSNYCLAKEPQQYYLADITSDGKCMLTNWYGENTVFLNYEAAQAVILRENNIHCGFSTCALDFGSNLIAKSLHKLAITPSLTTKGEVVAGYETRISDKRIKSTVGQSLSFEALDYGLFSFNSDFYKTFIKRVFERNFNYIIFKFSSSSADDFGIESFACRYSINHQLRGDR